MAEWNCRKCIVFGKTYNSVKEATEETYDKKKCRCEICNRVISKSQWYQWCQRYLEENDGHIICHGCKSKEIINEYNNSDKHFEDLSKRDKEAWKDTKYRKKMTKVLTDNYYKQIEDPNSNFNKARHERAVSEENIERLLSIAPNQMPHDEFFDENPRMYFELYRDKCQDTETFVYIGDLYRGRNAYRSYRQLDGKDYLKIGITTDIVARKNYKQQPSGVKKYHTIRKFPNRRQAALCEYLLIENFCEIGEAASIKYQKKIIKFIKEFNYNKEKYRIKKYLEIYYPEDLHKKKKQK